MDNRLRGWTGELFTLIAGQHQEQLSVQRGVLERIPHFQQALNGQNWIEVNERKFLLPEYEAETVANVIFYVHTGHVQELDYQSERPTEEQAEKVVSYVREWILADRWGAEATANALVDEIGRYHGDRPVNPELVSILAAADLQESPFYSYLIGDLASEVNLQTYEGWHVYGSTDEEGNYTGQGPTFKEVCDRLPSEVLVRLLVDSQNSNLGESPYERVSTNLCSLHKHKQTNSCGKEPPSKKAA